MQNDNRADLMAAGSLETKLEATLLEVARLKRELANKEGQIRNLIRNAIDAQEAERERVCLEVHDGVTQTLAAALQYFHILETIPSNDAHARQLLLRTGTLIKQAIQESREVINSLPPTALKDLGLIATLEVELGRLEQENGWEIEFRADAVRLPPHVETGLYRIIHEAIANARKHARTNRLHVTIMAADDRLRVAVGDWGIGFNCAPNDSARRGTGLHSMRKRAELLQGTFSIQSSVGLGTLVSIEIPCNIYRG